MSIIKKDVYNQIIQHSIDVLPIEACGYLAGKNGIITHAFKMQNMDNSSYHFSFSPEEQFKTIKEIRKLELDLIGNYHSHPSTPARPSQEDIRLAYDPDIIYIIVSLANKAVDMKPFRIIDNCAEIEELIIIK